MATYVTSTASTHASSMLSKGKDLISLDEPMVASCVMRRHLSTIRIKWLLKKSGEVVNTEAKAGDNVMRLAQRNDIPLEGACEGVAACSTCHCIFDPELYDLLPEASEKEEDMLDQAFGLTETSRLACQLKVEPIFKDTTITLPEATRNFYVDGHVPKPH